MARAFLTAEWRRLAMLNFAIEPAVLRPHTPQGTEVDAWEGTTYVSLVAFSFMDTRIKGIPIPFHRDFEEITEHYWGYSVQRGGGTVEYQVEHPQWNVWKADDTILEGDMTSFYGAEFAAAIASPPTSAFVADGSPVIVRQGERIEDRTNT